MLKKLALVMIGLGCAIQAQAFDKSQVNLKTQFGNLVCL